MYGRSLLFWKSVTHLRIELGDRFVDRAAGAAGERRDGKHTDDKATSAHD
jgi:hypothetical protein